MGDYLLEIKDFNSRKLLTKLRVSDHSLEIEIGRYKKIQREQRLCKTCQVLDDEKHFFLDCTLNNHIRLKLEQNIAEICPDYNQLSSLDKLKLILNPGQDILSNVVDYIKQGFELRK